MNDFAIKFEDVSKFFKLYESPRDRLKEALNPFVKKLHREFYALQTINLEIKKGEILGVVGRNGAGKSTFLKLISRVIQPSSGTVTVNGKISALLELGAGLHPDFTGMQNIYFSGTMMGFCKEEMESKVDSIVDFADIGEFIHQPLKTYSSGMKSRLGFALAINMEPEILILDEVLSVGDDLFRRKCFAKMEEFFNSGCTVLYVSHSTSSINEICRRAVLLDKGDLILDGPSKFVTMHYQKLLYTKPKMYESVRDEFIQLNQDAKLKEKFILDSGSENKTLTAEVVEKPVQKTSQLPAQNPFYIPDLQPNSTIITKNYDVDIFDIYLKTLSGEKVNVLVDSRKYILQYRVKFNIDVQNISFGINIKTEKGYLLSWAGSFTRKKRVIHLENVCKGDDYLVNWSFTSKFLPPRHFYFDVGVFAVIQGEEKFLNLIKDASVFKVQEIPEANFGGDVHFDPDVTYSLQSKNAPDATSGQ